MNYLIEDIKQTVTLKKMVRLLREDACITAEAEDGCKHLTPYLLTMMENREVYGVNITGGLNHIVISLVPHEKDEGVI